MNAPSGWMIIKSKRDSVCECGARIWSGQKIWWRSGRKAICFSCGNGDDPQERKLPWSERKRIQQLKDRLNQIANLPKPYSPTIQSECADIVAELKGYWRLRSVAKFLLRFDEPEQVMTSSMVREDERDDSTKVDRNNEEFERHSLELSSRDIQNSLQGMLSALNEERRAEQKSRCAVEYAESNDDVCTIKLRPGAEAKLQDVEEGWSVTTVGKSEDETWWGRIIEIDRVEPVTLVISVCSGFQRPDCGDLLDIYSPDYKQVIRSWLENRIREKRGLSDDYLSLRSGKFREDTSLPGPESALLQSFAFRPAQRRAVDLLESPLGIVWGPPGTGKTFTLGAMVALASQREKIIVLAPTNAAADQSVISIDDACKRAGRELKPGELIRPGNPRLPEIEKRPHLLAWSEKLKQVSQEILELDKELKRLEKCRISAVGEARVSLTEAIGKVKKQIKALKDGRSRELWKIAKEAKIIVCTLHSFLVNEPIIDSIEDGTVSLFIDEAAMVPRFMIARLMEFNFEQLLLFGDFKQLGPIRESKDESNENSKYWISESAFEVCGIETQMQVEAAESCGRLVMLTEQNRMHPLLCRIVSKEIYYGKLTTVEDVSLHPALPLLPEFPSSPVLLVDRNTPSVSPIFTPNSSHRSESKKACVKSAQLSVQIAELILSKSPNSSILLLTPFCHQSEELIRRCKSHLPQGSNWKAGTVHISQGQEADVVIFSPVDPGHPWLIGGYGEKELERLFCVTFSRARSHVIVVAPLADLSKNPLLRKLCAGAKTWRP